MSPGRIVWLATYPKSGTTWVRNLLSAALYPDTGLDLDAMKIPSAANRAFVDACLGLKTSDFTRDETRAMLPAAFRFWHQSLGTSAFLKTHDANLVNEASGAPLFPADISCGVVHIVRDPRDVAVSSRHYFGVSQDEAIANLNDSARWILATRPYLQLPTFLSDWTSHAASWINAPFPHLLVRYEDLLTDAQDSLRRIVAFCHLDISASNIQSAVQACGFDQLQALEREHGYGGHSARRAQPFFRSGRSGQWPAALDATQADCIEQAHGGMMRTLGYL